MEKPMPTQMLAIVNKQIFLDEVDEAGLGPGRVLDYWCNYVSDHPRLDRLKEGDRLYLVTVPPGTSNLWLLAVYEHVRRIKSGYPRAKRKNQVPITDITQLRDKLRFDNGIGIKWRHGEMPQSLQTPRILTAADVQLLERAIRNKNGYVLPAFEETEEELVVSIPRGASKADKERLREQCSRLARDQALRPQVIELWGPACAACGLTLSDTNGDHEVEVAHILAVSDKGEDALENTLPLCRTHHWAFDHYLWSIDPARLCLHVAPSLTRNPALSWLHGQKLRAVPKVLEHAAFLRGVRIHWQRFRRTHVWSRDAETHPVR